MENLTHALLTAVAAGSLTGSSEHQILDATVQAAAAAVNAEAGGLYLLAPSEDYYVIEVALGGGGHSLEHMRIPLNRGVPGLVMQTRQPMIVENDEHTLNLHDYSPRHVLCVPMMGDDEKVVGAIALYNTAPEPAFTSEHLEILSSFAHIGALAVAQAKLLQNVETFLTNSLGTAEAKETGRQIDEDYRDSIELAGVVASLLGRGDEERALCLDILRNIEAYFVRKEKALEIG